MSSGSGKTCEDKVRAIALTSLGQNRLEKDRSSSSAHQDLGERLSQLQDRFKDIDNTYSTQLTSDLTDQAEFLQKCLLTHLVTRVLACSSEAASSEAREIANELEAPVTSGIKIWQINRGAEEDIGLTRDFNNIRLGT